MLGGNNTPLMQTSAFPKTRTMQRSRTSLVLVLSMVVLSCVFVFHTRTKDSYSIIDNEGLFSPLLQSTQPQRVVITGASGQLGKIVTEKAINDPKFIPVAAVRSAEAANKLQGELSEDLETKLVDVAAPDAQKQLEEAFQGADSVIICTSAKPRLLKRSLPKVILGKLLGKPWGPKFKYPPKQAPKDIDYVGQLVQIEAAKNAGVRKVVLVSSMAGNDPNHFLNKNLENVVLWKRKAEIALVNSGLDYTIIHPGGLLSTEGGGRELVVDVDDKLMAQESKSIPREDVADVCLLALTTEEAKNRAFDLISKEPGLGSTFDGNLKKLLESLGGGNTDYSTPNLEELLS